MHDICTFFYLHEGADVVVPYEVPDNLSVAWYFFCSICALFGSLDYQTALAYFPCSYSAL